MGAAFDRPLPPALERLRDLARDLRWTWSHSADSLWHSVDPSIWERAENPWSILQDVRRGRLDQLAGDEKFTQDRRPPITVQRWNHEDGTPSITNDLRRDAAEYPALDSFVTQPPNGDEVGARLVG